MGCSATSRISVTGPLYLRLREHCEKGQRTKTLQQGSVLCGQRDDVLVLSSRVACTRSVKMSVWVGEKLKVILGCWGRENQFSRGISPVIGCPNLGVLQGEGCLFIPAARTEIITQKTMLVKALLCPLALTYFLTLTS